MYAWILNDTKGPSSYTLTEVDMPEPGPDEVRVKLVMSALNRLDLWMSMGLPAPKHFPHVAGGDGAGTIDALGEGVNGLVEGDEVIINPSIGYAPTTDHIPFSGKLGVLGEHTWGTFAEYVVVPTSNVAPKAPHLDWNHAAAYGLAYGTAYRMLRRARLSAGDLLVGGGSRRRGQFGRPPDRPDHGRRGLRHLAQPGQDRSSHRAGRCFRLRIHRRVLQGAEDGRPAAGRCGIRERRSGHLEPVDALHQTGVAGWSPADRRAAPRLR